MKRLAVVVVCCVLGCSSKVPQFSPRDQALLKRFQEQIGKHNMTACKQLCDQVEDMRKKNLLTDEQYNAFKQVCAKAVAQRWDQADKLVTTLLNGQAAAEP